MNYAKLKTCATSAGLLLIGATCGGKTELSAEKQPDFIADAQGGDPSISGGGSGATHPVSEGGSSDVATSTFAPAANGGAPLSCNAQFVDCKYGPLPAGPIALYGSETVHPSCSMEPDPTMAKLFVLQGCSGLRADTYGSDLDTVLSMYDGACSNAEIACDDDGAPGLARTSRLVIPKTASDTVTIAVTYSGNSDGTTQFHVSTSVSCLTDSLSGNIAAYVDGSTLGTTDWYVTACSTRVWSPDASYKFAPRFSGVYDIAITESDFDPLLAIVEGDCFGKELLCIDDRNGNKNPSVSRYLEGGKTYVVVVDSYGGTAGSFSLSITPNTSDPGYCCVASPTRASCTVDSIASCVCESWPTCCSDGWSEACLIAAESLGCGRDTRCDAAP